jgi:hypothetical protein
MLLSIACIAWIMNSIMLCSYMFGVRAANKTSTVVTWIATVILVVHIVVWAVAVGLFMMASDGTDLWGHSCDVSDEIQQSVESFLDFGKLCTVQVSDGLFG